jgi:hypothetical protein
MRLPRSLRGFQSERRLASFSSMAFTMKTLRPLPGAGICSSIRVGILTLIAVLGIPMGTTIESSGSQRDFSRLDQPPAPGGQLAGLAPKAPGKLTFVELHQIQAILGHRKIRSSASRQCELGVPHRFSFLVKAQ